jgi:hypothetical protein
MSRHLLLLVMLSLPLLLVAEPDLETRLISSLLQYQQGQANGPASDDERNLEKFTLLLEEAISKTELEHFHKFNATIDTLHFTWSKYESEQHDFVLYRLSSPMMYHWNYIIKDHKIILKNNDYHQYFTEVHNLNKREFLLISQMDELVFSCNYAHVYQYRCHAYVKKMAFGDRETLTVCNYTQIETGTDHYSIPVKKIAFDADTKTIYYAAFTSSTTDDKVIAKSKYTNGKFDIPDGDEMEAFSKE